MENTPQPEAQEPVPGGFWLRAGAYMIDGLVAGVPGAVLTAALTFAGLPNALSGLLGMTVSIAYFTYMPVAHEGRTLGKMAAGLAIIRTDGSPLTYGRAFGRWIGYYISSLPVFLGFLAALFTADKRALHDFIADTRVVVVKELGTLRKAVVICFGLLIPVAFLAGLAAAILIPTFSNANKRSFELSTKGDLGAIRAALSIYYGDHESAYPESLDALTENGIYLSGVPSARIRPHHEDNAAVQAYGAEVCSPSGAMNEESLRDTGGWGYVSAPDTPCHGMLFVDCTHPDGKGTPWHTY